MGSIKTITWAPDDVYSKVISPDQPRHVRGLRSGTTSTRQTCQHSISTSKQENSISKKEFDKMHNKLIELRNLVDTFM